MALIRTAALLLLLAVAAAVSAQETSYLYVVSRPMGATVSVNGKSLGRPAPLLLRDLEPGRYTVRVEKDGRYPFETTIELPGQSVVEAALVPESAVVYWDGPSPSIGPEGGAPGRGSGTAINVDSDPLTLSAARGGVSVTPLFAKQKTLDGIRLALPLFLALTAVLTVREIYAPRDSAFVISPELAASSIIGGGLLAWDIALHAQRARFFRDYRVRTASWETLSLAARLRFEKAEEALLAGNFDAALIQFSALAQEYPEDEIMPHALFEIARILFIRHDTRGAEENYRRIAEDYPLPGLHDRARKGLADCFLERGDADGALEQLDLLTFNGSGLTEAEARLFREAIVH